MSSASVRDEGHSDTNALTFSIMGDLIQREHSGNNKNCAFLFTLARESTIMRTGEKDMLTKTQIIRHRMLIDAMSGIDSETLLAWLKVILADNMPADALVKFGDEVARAGHMKGRHGNHNTQGR